MSAILDEKTVTQVDDADSHVEYPSVVEVTGDATRVFCSPEEFRVDVCDITSAS